jgi:catechol 2,3-dioxygenase-like lactoylglutathione lyase family enzyme
MHVIEATDTFTLVGVDAKLGKLTLFDAEGPRKRGALEHVALRVGDVDAAVAGLPQTAATRRCEDGSALLEAPGGVPLKLVRRGGVEFDLDHVVLRLPDRQAALDALARLGFESRNGALAVADRELRVIEAPRSDAKRPLLNHIALLVDSAEAVRHEADRRGVEVEDVKDAPNTRAVFLRGPAGVRIEYVEHKPEFALV